MTRRSASAPAAPVGECKGLLPSGMLAATSAFYGFWSDIQPSAEMDERIYDAIEAYLAVAPSPTPTAEIAGLVERLTDLAMHANPPLPTPDVRTLLEATQALQRLSARGVTENAWQPIETAVKDSRARLVWCPERRNTYVVVWDASADPKSEWLDLREPGWKHFGGDRRLTETPTHWSPLPSTPTSSGAKP